MLELLMSHQESFEITFKEGIYFLKGTLDEFSDLSILMSVKGNAKLDMGGIKWCNSIGLRNITYILGRWSADSFVYLNCSTSYVEQVNMVPALLGNKGCPGRIESLYVPYYCAACATEEEFLYDLSYFKDYLSGGAQPKRKCRMCQNEMSVEKLFFLFAQTP